MAVCQMLLSYYLIINYVASLQGGPQDFDCPMRELALQFSTNIQPWLSQTQLRDILDGLNGAPESQHCNLTLAWKLLENRNKLPSHYAPIWDDLIHPNIDANVKTIYVDYINGIDNNDGSINAPIKHINSAFIKLRKTLGKNYKNILKRVILRQGKHYIPKTLYFNSDDSNLLITNYNNEHVEVSAGLPLNCNWQQYKNGKNGLNYYKCQVPTNITKMKGLRINNVRGIRARYPNGNPEYYPCGFCSKLVPEKWIGEPSKPATVINPGPERKDGPSWQKYQLGIGGNCDHFIPNAGFWCNSGYKVPNALVYNNGSLPNAPYANVKGAVVQAMRSAHWSSWMFAVSSYDANKLMLNFSTGGFQGGRGGSGQEFFVENIYEELDYPGEWFFNDSTRTLYFYNNNTNGIDTIKFEVTNLKVIMNYTGQSMTNPVKNVEIRGITFRDTEYTYLDAHGMPSGGDWALQRTGAIYLDNTEDVMITTNLLTRLDGNGVSINRYNRNVTVYKNEFSWIGGSSITLWGDTENITAPIFNDTGDYQVTTMGYDGTNGNQPRMTNILQNVLHETGIFEKQSSFYFQAKTCSNYIYGNIMYNAPRAGINFNDGFGGNTTLKKNLVFNCVRETSDHGPFNSWDRQVYVTKVRNGSPSTTKQYDYITQNFMIGNYNTGWTIDNDDGSSYYKIFNNFLIYAGHAMKSGHGGHDILHYGNIDAYHSTCMDNEDDQLVGHINGYYNNSCIIAGQPKEYVGFKCGNAQNVWPQLGDNSVYIDATNTSVTGLCGINEKSFQQKYKDDLGTIIIPGPIDNKKILQQAKTLLWS
eukprot:56800_1